MRGSLRVLVMLVAAVALLVACGSLGIVAGTPSEPTAQPSLAVAPALETPSEVGSPPPQATALETPSDGASTPAPTETPASPISSGYRITIPRLGIDLLIKEGDLKRDVEDQRTPENYAFHLPGTAWPGQNGNTYLYAHARRGMFLALWNARPGDEVFVSAPDGRVLLYLVRDIMPRVAPTDVSSTLPTTTERLTLQTSTGPSPSNPRFVVFAFLRSG